MSECLILKTKYELSIATIDQYARAILKVNKSEKNETVSYDRTCANEKCLHHDHLYWDET